MPLVPDRCICVRKTEYSETSQILTLLAREHGLLRVIAKGAHRRTKAGASKFDGGIDLLDVGQAVFMFDPARDLQPLYEWHLSQGHLELRKNLRGMYLALYAGELASLLIEEHDPHPELFDLLESTVAQLSTSRAEEAFLAFELAILQQTGHLAELAACVECGSDFANAAYFSPRRGGVVCRNCEGAIPDRMELDVRLLRMAQQVLKLPQRLPRLTRHQTDPLNKILAEHIEQTLGKRLRMPKYVLA